MEESTKPLNNTVISTFLENLRNKSLLPKPHLGVINTKSDYNIEGGLFTSSDRPTVLNSVGYDLTVKAPSKNGEIKSEFSFYVRSGELISFSDVDGSFTKINIKIIYNLEKSEMRVFTKIGNIEEKEEGVKLLNKVGEKEFYEYILSKDLPLKFLKKENEEKIEESNKVRLRFSKNIENLGGNLYKVQFQVKNLSAHKQLQIMLKDRDNSYKKDSVNLGLILDYELKESCLGGCEFEKDLKKGSCLKRLLNVLPQEEDGDRIVFRDYYVGKETIPKFRKGIPMRDFVNQINSNKKVLSEHTEEVFRKVWKTDESPRFYKYQEEGIKEIIEELENPQQKVNLISVRTAGGKTETFTVPVVNYCLKKKERKYTKALIFYPTKALANDQAERIFKILYFYNKYLKEEESNKKITMGLYHGDIKSKSSEEKSIWVPWKCPNCEKMVGEKVSGINHFLHCYKCGETFDFLYLTKYQIHKETPDIVITNQDTLNYRLMESPESHSLFGKEIYYCGSCGNSQTKKGNCSCGSQLMKVIPEGFPEIVVFDEIHMLKGAFGMNTALFLKRLEKSIKYYSQNEEYKPVYIGSSATIKDPKLFAKKLFPNYEINLIPKSNPAEIYEEVSEENIKRDHLFILPTVFSSSETTAFGVSFILDSLRDSKEKPHILGFNNSLKDCRDLISRTQARALKNSKINGHTSQFEKETRAEIERSFSKGEIDVLYATSTLEVGVDFDDVNVLIIHGAPYSFNDFLQRIGRSGRKRDATVVTSLRSWNPIDYFYFENCKIMLESSEKFIESPPLNKRNTTLLEKQAKCAIFDFLSCNKNSRSLVSINDLRKYLSNNKETSSIDEEIKKEIREHLVGCFGQENKIISEAIDWFEKKMFLDVNQNIQYIGEAIKSIKEREQIQQLRISDKQVEVDFII